VIALERGKTRRFIVQSLPKGPEVGVAYSSKDRHVGILSPLKP
jgi:hypothetical protein